MTKESVSNEMEARMNKKETPDIYRMLSRNTTMKKKKKIKNKNQLVSLSAK